MIVNPDKFQAIVVKRNHQILDSYPLHIMNENNNSKASVKLLGNDTYVHRNIIITQGIPCQENFFHFLNDSY